MKIMNLSEKEEKYLLRFEETAKRIILNYIVVSLLFCMALFGLIVAVKLENRIGFVIAIFFGTIGANVLMVSITYRKLYRIILKIKQ